MDELLDDLINELNEDNLIKCKGISFYNTNNEFIFTGYDSPPSADEISSPDYNILEKIGFQGGIDVELKINFFFCSHIMTFFS